jgi:hypothetical protein
MHAMTNSKGRSEPTTPRTAERASTNLTLDLVGLTEAVELAGIGRALSLRRQQHSNFPEPVADLRSGPVWFRSQIKSYLAHKRKVAIRAEVPQLRPA